MQKLPAARKPGRGKRETTGRGKGGEREGRAGDQGGKDGGHPEHAWRASSLIPSPRTPEFSRLGQDPAPSEFGPKLLPPHIDFQKPWGKW